MLQSLLLLPLFLTSAFATPHDPTAHQALEKRATFPIPSSKGSVTLRSTQYVKGTFDGGMKTYGRGVECTGQKEGGEKDAVFVVEEGGILKNVIIGADQIKGVYCKGSCTIQNVWWKDVCEDALSLKGSGSGTYKIIGGGAQNADDKVIQHNSGGTVMIQGFTVSNFGKLYRSCGNCSKQYKRSVQISGVKAYNGKTLVGINSNYGDTASIDACASSVKDICVEYEGTNNNGKEPKKKSSGPSKACEYNQPLKKC
ncbi:pectate lyase [Aspergillus clavatus NRRL 1]|uniref:Probable pectate lyase E n=1 Tax=Aspergillus clavatus (strain ATCC 1007 / CBS 513.65 / DSM 816 / NCTC 3887 / NRRL 1 / QM 1276 / 107) TaxID=344612 RepID=PLYE_ASPCL|nr:pectate lyase, putative [Aspergillus clavatus NRRL 1]A1C4B8.1 RecName: Full=Probable pectate lyase E; Flags: Precursor [Aspergillus clavatus NRRL 1]EAW15258.1 pectate lyase, putative [Aspergillus clavatus NRRL 1]